MIALRGELRRSGFDLRSVEAKVLCRAIDHLLSSASTIDWPAVGQLLDALNSRVSFALLDDAVVTAGRLG